MSFTIYICLLPFLAMVSGRIYSIERPDGSFTIGVKSNSKGETANSFSSLVSKASGYNIDVDYDTTENTQQESRDEPMIESRVDLSPHLEILQLVETFLRFKGQIGSRLNDLLNDNYDLIRSVYMTLINKISTLHSFTLSGITILRKILQFAVSLMAQWQINLPSVSFNVDGSQQGVSLNKNTNFYGRR